MTTALTDLATKLEAEMTTLLKEGMDIEKVWGYQLGYRAAMAAHGLLGDIEEEALSRHFEPFFYEHRNKTEG